MFDFDRLDSIAKHLILDLTIGHRKTVMLSLMFGPGINLEALEISIRSFCIDEDSPTRRAIPATDPLIFVDAMEKLRGLRWINHIFHGHEDWPFAGIRYLNCRQFAPMVPGTEIRGNSRQLE
jgi:hypothetical protein